MLKPTQTKESAGLSKMNNDYFLISNNNKAMSIVEEKALDHIEVPQLDNHSTKIKFNLCHINKLTSDTHGFSNWHDRLTNRHSP